MACTEEDPEFEWYSSYLRQHKESLLLCLLSEEQVPSYTELVSIHSNRWGLSREEVLYVHDLFYEYFAEYHFGMHIQELCLRPYGLVPQQLLPGEQTLGAPWVARILSAVPQSLQQQQLQQRLAALQVTHLKILRVTSYTKRQRLMRLLFEPQQVELSPVSSFTSA